VQNAVDTAAEEDAFAVVHIFYSLLNFLFRFGLPAILMQASRESWKDAPFQVFVAAQGRQGFCF
jgi:hypothetical protein